MISLQVLELHGHLGKNINIDLETLPFETNHFHLYKYMQF